MSEEAAQKEEKRIKLQEAEIATIQKIKQKVQAEHEEFKSIKDDDFVGFFKLYSKIQSDTRHYFESNRQWKDFFRMHDSYLRHETTGENNPRDPAGSREGREGLLQRTGARETHQKHLALQISYSKVSFC